MILNRDPEFWHGVASHPMVAPYVTFGQMVDWSFLSDQRVIPLSSEHGGYMFFKADGLGRVLELHTMFTPEGWGKEAASMFKEALDHVFSSGAQIVVTLEMQDNRRSQPPKSFGWKPTGGFDLVNGLDQLGKTWFLTQEAWIASPAKKRSERQCRF